LSDIAGYINMKL